MTAKDQIGRSSIQKLIPVWLMNRWGFVCGVVGIYILLYTAWTRFHWGATENFRLVCLAWRRAVAPP